MKGKGRFFERIRCVDPTLFAATSFLTLISLLTIWGAVDNFGRSKLVMQIAMSILGALLVFIISNTDYRFFVDRYWVAFLVISGILLSLTLVLGVSGTNMDTANRSWLPLWPGGPTIQPSEFVKIAFICTFAKHLDLVHQSINRPKTLLLLFLHGGLVIGLILLSGDLGVALIYIGIFLAMLFFAGLSLWYFLGMAVLAALAVPLIWQLLAEYQRNRILVGFSPELDPFGYGMQPLMSAETIARGGLFGRGLFEGGLYEDLAASHTDFIFSTVCEKLGFVGGFLVLLSLSVLIVRTVVIGFRTRERLGRFICFGVAIVLILQTLENIGMCLALIPVVGITLPFVSCGGSSMLALYVLIGLVHSVNSKEKKLFFR